MPEMRSSVAFYALLFSILTVGGIGIWWLQREVETVASEATPAAAEKPEGGSQTSAPDRSRATPGVGQSEDEGSPSGAGDGGGGKHPAWPNATIVLQEERNYKNDKAITRLTIVQPDDLPYPVRIEEKLVRDPESGEEEVLSRREMVASHFLVQLREDRAEADLAAQAAALGAAVRPHPSSRGLYFLELRDLDPHDYSKILAAFEEESSLVRYAEPDYIVRTFQTFPDDALFSQLWGMHNTGQSGGNPDSDIDAPEGWAIRNDAAAVIVAVIDTGIRYTHEDLAGNMWINPGETSGNGVDDDSNGYVDDVFGFNAINGSGNPNDDNEHGTHVAGTIGAVGNNGVGVAGVAWNVQLMALKFLSAGGSGSVGNAIECIDYGIAKGAHIMSNS